MSATDDVPANELAARRERLKALKAKAGAHGAGATAGQARGAGGMAGMGGGGKGGAMAGMAGGGGEGGAAFSGDRSKYFATFLLNTLRSRPENEKDPAMVPGTAFTESGLGKFKDGLKERSELMGAQGKPIIKRFYDFLTSPPSAGQQVHNGVNLEHLERFVNLLTQMQKTGWDGVKKDFASGSGKEMLEAFSKPKIEVMEKEVDALKAQVEALTAKLEALTRK